MSVPTSVVTPERELVCVEVDAVDLRTAEGEAAFLPGHAPLIGSVVPGLVRLVQPEGAEIRLAVHGGFVHVENDRVQILAPVAELADEIDLERARRAAEVAEARLAELRGSEEGDPELVELRAALRRAQLRIEVAGA
ncbi:MAG: ATP synthase F1 subunit epsilon [Actinomycetota bacterium]|jgi:F-type H+-transporting ATPase subunit epsilon|nr:ATP synthase F1 subunit epsilon [Actinomycetota bacterium]